MAISNGFDNTRVLAALSTRLGWRNGQSSPYNGVATPNTASKSGRYFNDGSFYEGSTIENLYDCGPKHADATAFNTWLTQKREAVTLAAVQAVFNQPQTVEHGLLFNKWYNSQLVPVPNEGKFVGIKLKVADGNYTAQVTSLQLLFDGAATFTLYLFNDLKAAPLWSKEVTTEAYNQVNITDLAFGDNAELTLSYRSANVKGGNYFLGYFQSELGDVQALDFNVNDDKCLHIVGADPFVRDAISSTEFARTASDKPASVNSRTYGLNLDITVYKDHTEAICRQPHLFDELLGLMMAVNVVELVQVTRRVKGDIVVQQDKMAQLNRDLNAEQTEMAPISPGLKAKVRNEIKRVRDAFFPKQGIIVTTPSVCH